MQAKQLSKLCDCLKKLYAPLKSAYTLYLVHEMVNNTVVYIGGTNYQSLVVYNTHRINTDSGVQYIILHAPDYLCPQLLMVGKSLLAGGHCLPSLNPKPKAFMYDYQTLWVCHLHKNIF